MNKITVYFGLDFFQFFLIETPSSTLPILLTSRFGHGSHGHGFEINLVNYLTILYGLKQDKLLRLCRIYQRILTFLYLFKYLKTKLNSSLKSFPYSSFHSLMHLIAKSSRSAANFFGGGNDRSVSMLTVSFRRIEKSTIINFLKC